MHAPPVVSDIKEIVRQAIEKHGKTFDALIPILSEINHVLGYIAEAMRELQQQFHNPAKQNYLGKLNYSLASFYDMLSTKPRGKHVIKFCENAPCHVVGGKAIWDALRKHLNLDNGGTTPDNQSTLVTTSCIGLCSAGLYC